MRRPQVFCPTASDRRLTPFTWPNQNCRRVSSHVTGYFSQTLTAASRLMNESFQAPALSFLLARFPSQCTSTKDSGGRGGAHDGHCSPTASKYLPHLHFPPPCTPLSLLGDLTLHHPSPVSPPTPPTLPGRQRAPPASQTGEPRAPFTLSRVYQRRSLPRKSSSRLTDGGKSSTCLCARRSLLPTACLLYFPGNSSSRPLPFRVDPTRRPHGLASFTLPSIHTPPPAGLITPRLSGTVSQ